MKPRYWQGRAETCGVCRQPLLNTMIDGATLAGPWALMCAGCHARIGAGIGQGLGQEYQRTADNRWLKVGG